MKNFIWISLLLFIILGCGSRKTNLEKSEEKSDQNIQSSGQTNLNIRNSGEINKTSNVLDLGFNFSLDPINGQNSFFKIIKGKDTMAVETNAKINFNQNNRTEQTVTKTIWETITILETITTYKSHTTFYSKTKNKTTDREAYPWYWIAIGSILIYKTLEIILKQFLNKNSLSILWNRLTKKQ